MEQPLFKKPETPNFADPAARASFVHETATSKELLQKELDVNKEEQNLLDKRIRMMKEFVNDLPASDPQYSMLVIQIQMDQIERDELKTRELCLIEKLSDQ
jgi:hypothetical protein